MERVLSFKKYILNEGFIEGLDEFPKINFISPQSLLIEREYGRGVSVTKKLYHLYRTDTVKPKLDNRFPVVVTGRDNKDIREYLLKNYGENNPLQLNKLEDNFSTNKVEFAKLFSNKKWNIKTVFDKKSAEQILKDKGGVVGKPSEGHSGIGIDFIKDLKSLEKSNFELYQEPIKIQREFRGLMIQDKIVYLMERVSKKKGDEQLKEKGIDGQMSFVYICTDMAKLLKEYGFSILDISKEIYKKTNLDVYVMDFVVNEKGEYKVIELNLNPGPVTPIFIMRAAWVWWLANGKSWDCSENIDNALYYDGFWTYCNEQMKISSSYYYNLLSESDKKLCLYPLYKNFENGLDIRDLISQYLCYYE